MLFRSFAQRQGPDGCAKAAFTSDSVPISLGRYVCIKTGKGTIAEIKVVKVVEDLVPPHTPDAHIIFYSPGLGPGY